MAEERTTEEERNHIMEARRRVANKRKKVKLTGSKSTETDDDDDEGLIKNQGRMSCLGRVSFFACSLLKRDFCCRSKCLSILSTHSEKASYAPENAKFY